MNKIACIERKLHPDANQIADSLEKTAASIRSGETPISAIHLIEVDIDGTWRNYTLGKIWVSTLIGYLMRCVHELIQRTDG